jgi:hypothetical protein
VRKHVIGVVIGVLALAFASVAYAQKGDPANTTAALKVGISPTKAGTKKKPKAVSLNLGILGGTKNGTGQPATSTALNNTLAPGFRINSKSWPKKSRCNLAKMRAQKSPNSCPKSSKVGSGLSIAKANGGGFVETLKVSAFVLTNGNIGFYLLGTPTPLNKTLEGKVVKGGRGLNVVIDPDVQQPAPGFFTGITKLQFKLKASAKVNGKKIGIVQTTSCPKSKKWKFSLASKLLGGTTLNSTATVACK